MKLLILALFAVAFATVVFADDEKWEHYKSEHHLELSGEEEQEAKENFLNNLKNVEQNKKDSLRRSGKKPEVGTGITSHSHLSDEKFAEGALGLVPAIRKSGAVRQLHKVDPNGKPVQSTYYPETWKEPTNLPASLPKNFDWRTHGAVRDAADQSPCGCCYVFSGVATLEAAYFLRTGKKVKLSEEYVKDCIFTSQFAQRPKDACKGGDPMNVYQMAAATGLVQDSEMSFARSETPAQCPSRSSNLININVTSVGIAQGEQQIMKALLAAGPLAASMDASELSNSPWNAWKGVTPSVYPGARCSKSGINHAITLIGYGEDASSGKYWLFRNSWGTSWGDKGTFKMPRGSNTCASELEAKWPCVDGQCYLQRNPAFSG